MIGHPFDIAQIREGSFSVDNLPVYSCANQLTDNPDDVEQFGDCDVFMSLGLTAKPFPPTSGTDNDGAAEALILRDVGNTDGVVAGARDARSAFVYGGLNDGDTVVHSVEPDASAQLQCKANRQVALFTKDTEGNNIFVLVDGKNDKIQIPAFGGLIELTPSTLSLIAPGGKASIVMDDAGKVTILGELQLGGLAPTHAFLAALPSDLAAIQGIVSQIKQAGNCTCTAGP
jgi:hypothetical protein